MSGRAAWRLARYGKIDPGPGARAAVTLPAISEACAIYLAVTLSERRRLTVVPESCARRLIELGWLERATYALGLAHAIVLFDIAEIEAAFPPLSWRCAASSSTDLSQFCVEVFAQIESLWKAGSGPVGGEVGP